MQNNQSDYKYGPGPSKKFKANSYDDLSKKVDDAIDVAENLIHSLKAIKNVRLINTFHLLMLILFFVYFTPER